MILSPARHTLFLTALALTALGFAVLTMISSGNGRGPENLLERHVEQGSPAPAAPDVSALETRVDALMGASIRSGAFPGAAVAIGGKDSTLLLKGYGRFTFEGGPAVTPRSLFDMASLTKVIATTTAAMMLYEAGKLDLDAPLVRYLPEFSRPDRDAITIRQLLTHSAGLVAFRPYHTLGLQTRDEVIKAILSEPLSYTPGTKVVYSDHGMILLALAMERIMDQDFATWTYRNIFQPLGMRDTGYRYKGTDPTVVPTEVDKLFRKRLVQGEVHDETAYLLGGTAGHAGLFSTAEDVSRFARMLLNGGRVGSRQFLKPETIRLFTARATNLGDESTRALGWDTKNLDGYTSAGKHFGPNSFGHTGFTGTSFWVEPDAGLFVVLFTNRVYPTRENGKISEVRPALADAAYEVLVGSAASSAGR